MAMAMMMYCRRDKGWLVGEGERGRDIRYRKYLYGMTCTTQSNACRETANSGAYDDDLHVEFVGGMMRL
jgi:hypothetical protein